MKTHNGFTRLQFVAYLRNTLIPDFRAADMDATAEDFETALQFIAEDAELMHDARKALRLAMPHTPADTTPADTTAVLCGELNEALDPPKS